jgi:predicted transcriptional regulator
MATPTAKEKFSGLAVAGEDIGAGSSVMLALGSNLVFATGQGHAGEYVGEAVEQIREGFRVNIKDCEVREDDA